jgi:hypothetical protein
LFLAINRSNGDNFLVVVGAPVVVDTCGATSPSPSAALASVVEDDDVVVVVVAAVVVVVVGLVFGASGERPSTGNLGRGFLVVVTVGMRISVGLSVKSSRLSLLPETCLAVGNSAFG